MEGLTSKINLATMQNDIAFMAQIIKSTSITKMDKLDKIDLIATHQKSSKTMIKDILSDLRSEI